MNINSSPGPNGFGPTFYRLFWPLVKHDVQDMFSAFHDGSLPLDGLNRAHLVLLPKKEGTGSADAFRPISLQGCLVKAISKVLTTRLQSRIRDLVGDDQSGFIKQRCISDNFVYAVEILSCCHKRRAPTIVLKLDFRKAFDSINWDNLYAILEARGLDAPWRSWVASLLETGCTAILLNGVPRRWINCKKGLPQGDSLSPYLFIIVADILRAQIVRAFQSGLLAHPLLDDASPPILQYADDTLLLLRGDRANLSQLKRVLDDFSSATCLEINFHKSTFVPMNIDPTEASAMAHVLGCPMSSFPQPYLGLPLCTTKLHNSDYIPLIAKCDKYLAGWKGRLLSKGGHLVLINSVLSAVPVYHMCSLPLPKGVIAAIDRRRRSFLWTGDDSASSSQCLIAWKRVCLPKEEGGLGIKSIGLQNRCLLLKFTHKLFHHESTPWTRWLDVSGPSHGHMVVGDSFLRRVISENMQTYRSLTKVHVHDGCSTLFWFDDWTDDGPLCLALPVLFSHTTKPHVSVAAALATPLATMFQPRLTQVATGEFTSLGNLLNSYGSDDGPDDRTYIWDGTKLFSSAVAYRALSHMGYHDPNANRIWGTRVLTKLKFFAWLLCSDCLPTRNNLFTKHILERAANDCPRCTSTLETGHHLFFACPSARQLYQRLDLTLGVISMENPWELPCPLPTLRCVWDDVVIMLMWRLWKSRNDIVFNRQETTTAANVRFLIADLDIWGYRYKDHRHIAALARWRAYLTSRCL